MLNEQTMYKYRIKIQFATASSPSFYDVKSIILDAKEFFNTRSMMAANPKEIELVEFLDNKTLFLTMTSKNKINENMEGKTLRMFTSYLIDEKIKGNLKHLITGKRLFKMTCVEIKNPYVEKHSNIEHNDLQILEYMSKFIKMIDSGDKVKFNKIKDILDEK